MFILYGFISLIHLFLDRLDTIVHSHIIMGKTSHGVWSEQAICSHGVRVKGFRLQLEDDQKFEDDTALNGIQLLCADGNPTIELKGPLGAWKDYVECKSSSYVTGLNYR